MKAFKIIFIVMLMAVTLSMESCMMYARPARVAVRPAPVIVAAPVFAPVPVRRRPLMVARPYRCHPRRFCY